MRVYILRHGEAEPCQTSDIDRNLSVKGVLDIGKVADYLNSLNVVITHTYVSPYVRTRQTFACLSDRMDSLTPPHIAPELTPESTPAEVLPLLQCLDAEHVLLVSHQPLVSSLVALLADNNSARRYDYAMMPSSLAIIDLHETLPGCGVVKAIIHAEQLG